MEYRAVVKNVNKRTVELLLESEVSLHELQKHSVNGHILAYVDFYEKDGITDLQRNHLYALFGDIVEYTGVPLDAVEAERKYRFMLDEGLDELPSLARGKMRKTNAAKFLEHTIDHCIQNGIPFRKQQFYLTMDTSKMLFALTMKRICFVCGKPHADVHHWNALGMGRNRNDRNYNHSMHKYASLCREHHVEIETIGTDAFVKKHHIGPVKLSEKDLRRIGVQK